jgi:hypothetical protein
MWLGPRPRWNVHRAHRADPYDPEITMTATAALPATDSWTAQLEQLTARFKHVRKPIVAALNVLLHSRAISNDDAKAQAAARGFRITAASIAGARTLLEKMDARTTTAAAPIAPPARPQRRVRAPEPVDAEALVRGFVAKLKGQGNAEAERLRVGIRKAIAVLQAAVGWAVTDVPFDLTVMGRRFVEHTVPALVEAIERLTPPFQRLGSARQ